jgi:hypothetical protein
MAWSQFDVGSLLARQRLIKVQNAEAKGGHRGMLRRVE